jgi:hypothetical protein
MYPQDRKYLLRGCKPIPITNPRCPECDERMVQSVDKRRRKTFMCRGAIGEVMYDGFTHYMPPNAIHQDVTTYHVWPNGTLHKGYPFCGPARRATPKMAKGA